MLRPLKNHAGRRFGFTCLVRGREAEGRKAVIKQGPVTTRIAPIDSDGVVNGDSHCVPSRDVDDIQPDVRNQKKRPMGHHAGRSFPTTVRVKGLDNDCRQFLVQAGAVETRVIGIGPDGRSAGQSFVIPSEFIFDPEDAEHSGTELTTISDRGEVVIPARLRAAKEVNGRWNVEVELTADGWFIRPVGPAEQ